MDIPYDRTFHDMPLRCGIGVLLCDNYCLDRATTKVTIHSGRYAGASPLRPLITAQRLVALDVDGWIGQSRRIGVVCGTHTLLTAVHPQYTRCLHYFTRT